MVATMVLALYMVDSRTEPTHQSTVMEYVGPKSGSLLHCHKFLFSTPKGRSRSLMLTDPARLASYHRSKLRRSQRRVRQPPSETKPADPSQHEIVLHRPHADARPPNRASIISRGRPLDKPAHSRAYGGFGAPSRQGLTHPTFSLFTPRTVAPGPASAGVGAEARQYRA